MRLRVREAGTAQDDFGAGVGDELEDEDDPLDDDPLEEEPEEDGLDAAAADFSAGLAAGAESVLLSDLAALLSADRDDLPLDSARESLR